MNWIAITAAALLALLGAGLLLDRCDSREKDCRQAAYVACTAAGQHECSMSASRACGANPLR